MHAYISVHICVSVCVYMCVYKSTVYRKQFINWLCSQASMAECAGLSIYQLLDAEYSSLYKSRWGSNEELETIPSATFKTKK